MVWIPLIHIGGQRYVRTEFPSVTFYAPDTQYGQPVETILPTYEGHLNSAYECSVSIKTAGLCYSSTRDVLPARLLTFPTGISNKYHVLYKFPECIDQNGDVLGPAAGSILLCLHIDNDYRRLAFGGLRFAGDDMAAELLFIAKLKEADSPSIVQSTCRGITQYPVSISYYYDSISPRHRGGGHRFAQNLHGDRYREITQHLYRQGKSDKQFWRFEEVIKCGKDGKFDGHVLMDDRVYDPTNSKFLSPTATVRSSRSKPPGPWITVQIVFPTLK